MVRSHDLENEGFFILLIIVEMNLSQVDLLFSNFWPPSQALRGFLAAGCIFVVEYFLYQLFKNKQKIKYGEPNSNLYQLKRVQKLNTKKKFF